MRLTAAGPPLRDPEAPIHRIAAVVARVGALLVLGACSQLPAPGPLTGPSVTVDGHATVVRVVDGDTIVVRIGGHDEPVRLIGIDTPESVKPASPVECFGQEAARHLTSLLPARAAVRLVGDAEPRDRYGRLLAYVYREADDLFVNAAMAREGLAEPLTIPPNVAHTAELVAAARSARDGGKGLWAACPGADDSALGSG